MEAYLIDLLIMSIIMLQQSLTS